MSNENSVGGKTYIIKLQLVKPALKNKIWAELFGFIALTSVEEREKMRKCKTKVCRDRQNGKMATH